MLLKTPVALSADSTRSDTRIYLPVSLVSVVPVRKGPKCRELSNSVAMIYPQRETTRLRELFRSVRGWAFNVYER